MKTILYFKVMAVIALLSFCSCESFLEVKPTDVIVADEYFTTEKEAEMYLGGTYKVLNSLYGINFLGGFSSVTDQLVYTATNTGEVVISKLYTSTTPAIYSIWNDLYRGIYYSNLFLAKVDKVKGINDAKRNSLTAEARFLRAYFYYHLAVLWGDVPLRLTPIESPIGVGLGRTPVAEVYAQIVADLVYAKDNLLAYSQQKGAPVRACKEAAVGILGRVYLTMAGEPLKKTECYQLAIDVLKPLVESNVIKLNADYTQIWKNISADVYDHNSKEIMFDVEFKADETMYMYRGWGSGGSPAAYNNSRYGIGVPLWRAYQSDLNDVRYPWNICEFRVDGKGVKVMQEVIKPDGSNAYKRGAGKFRRDWDTYYNLLNSYNGHNFPVLRYSDVLLMLAEAENEVNGATSLAYSALDAVRDRAKAFRFADRFPGMSQENFRQVIKDERSRELCFESTTRYYDLLRWGDLMDVFGNVARELRSFNNTSLTFWAQNWYESFKSHMLLFPIPYEEVQLNEFMVQNPGW